MELTSWRDGLLVGGPMVAALMVTFFRLDEVWTRRPGGVERRTLAGGVDGNGMPICLEPDGSVLGRMLSHVEFRRRSGRGGDWLMLERK